MIYQQSSSVVVALRLMVVVASLPSLFLVVARVSSSRKSSGTEIVSGSDGGSSCSNGDSCGSRDPQEGVDVGSAGDTREGGGSLSELGGRRGLRARRVGDKGSQGQRAVR